MAIADIQHPDYTWEALQYEKWRLVYHAGEDFITRYLVHLSDRESRNDYLQRLAMTYCPAFAKAGINEIKNSIFAKLGDIRRVGSTSISYNEAIVGDSGGVDLIGNSMNTFIGCKIIEELLVMRKVGVFVDMQRVKPNASLIDIAGKHPYIYMYRAEDILSWIKDDSEHPNEFTSILLRECKIVEEETLGLPNKQQIVYRHITKTSMGVHIKIYGDQDVVIEEIDLDIPKIPFVLFEISNSLLCDVANYQIALLNIASTDVSYLVKANFPFYTEHYDPKAEQKWMKDESSVVEATDGTESTTNKKEIRVGATTGRRIPKGLESPQFIHPSSEPIKASMEKQQEMRDEIRLLLNLALSNVKAKSASAAAKQMDMQGLEAGLSYIGLELQLCEQRIAEYWAMYEKETPATVQYPEQYSVESPEDRRLKIDQYVKLIDKVASDLYRRELMKEIATLLLGPKVTRECLEKIHKQIDNAQVLVTDLLNLQIAIENGLVSNNSASLAAGFPEGEATKAATDHADKLARIAAAQTPKDIQGVGATQTDPKNPMMNKKTTSDSTMTGSNVPAVRGKGATQ